MIFGGNVKNIYNFHVQPINPRHPEMYLHHYMCGRSCFASLAPKHGSSVHVLAVGELFRNHGVELVLRHLRRNCQCLHLKQALTRTAIQSLHTLAAFGRRATNHVSCMTKLEIRRVLPRIIKDMCLLSIKNMRGVCLRMLSLNKAASPWNVDMPYKMKDRLYIYIYTYGCFLCQNFLSIHGSHRESKI